MNWWRRERSEPRPEGGASGAFRSRGLEVLTGHLTGARKFQVLDLGSPTGANVRYFEPVSCRLHFAGLDESLATGAGGPLALAEDGPEAWFEFDPDVQFDVVLGWDLLNYLDVASLDRVFGRIRRHARPGTLLWFLIATEAEMPALPARFEMSREGELRWSRAPCARVPSPRHTPRDLARRMSGFEVLHMFLLRDGMQEYACRFDHVDVGAVHAVADPSRAFTRGRLA